MTRYTPISVVIALLAVVCFLPVAGAAQDSVAVLAGPELSRVVPTGFYFQGLSAPTQMRNAAAARFGADRYIVVGMVDTSGYSSEIRAKYQGFFITDSPVTVGGSSLEIGAYGFGFSNDGKFNVLDLSGKEILSVSTSKDSALRRPRPLMMTKTGDRLRLYSGRDYLEIAGR
jgi:hypothetical protein